jgi:DeoR family glycerol-3-phosphate regulon repressor
VHAQGSVTVEQLADTLGVTLQTVRRDVQRLADGFAYALSRRRAPAQFDHRRKHCPQTAQRASTPRARRALRSAWPQAVPNDCSLILNIGTTTEAIARALSRHSGLRVMTNNLNVASILSSNPKCEVIVAGGVVRTRDRGIVGEAAVDFIRQFKVDIASSASRHRTRRLAARLRLPRSQSPQTIMAHAREVWLAADLSKFKRRRWSKLATLDQIDRLFTDAPPPEPFPALLAEAQVRLTVAAHYGPPFLIVTP